MIGKDLLKTIITDGQQRVIPEVWERVLKVPADSGKIITLAGVEAKRQDLPFIPFDKSVKGKRRVRREDLIF